MDNIVKGRLLSVIVIVLLIANMVTMVVFWTTREKKIAGPSTAQGNVAEFLTRELQFDSAQKEAYLKLRQEHQDKVREIRSHTREAKDALFNLLQKPAVTNEELQWALNDIGQNEMALDKQTFTHFQQVRALCNDDQKKKFYSVIKEALHMMAPPMGRRPDGPPPTDGGPGGPGFPPPGGGEHQRQE